MKVELNAEASEAIVYSMGWLAVIVIVVGLVTCSIKTTSIIEHNNTTQEVQYGR